ncbi:MAG: class I SAM-dependent methyltransferase [Acidobacteria bacterium]|nr:class I SAM-dependent methyltransferase [Acidobacteriota bacterium]
MTRHMAPDWAAARSEKWRRQLAGLEAMLAPIDDPLFAGLAITDRVRIADVACGSGTTTIDVLRRAPAGSVAHGFDLSPALIDVARRRQGGQDTSVAFDVADMQTASPPELPYERLMSRLGVMFFADPAAAFANLRRWLVPGGRFAFAVWGPVEDNTWMAATRAAVAEFAELPPVDPSTPGPFRYADVTVLHSLLSRAGFVELTASDWRGTLPIGSSLPAQEAAHFALAAFSSFAEVLAAAGARAFAGAHHTLAARFAPYEQEGVVRMPARVHIVSGRSLEP